MKKTTIVVLAMLFTVTALAGSPIGLTISTNSAKLLPERNVRSAAAWAATTTVTQGSLRSSGDWIYMALDGGTSGTNAPSGAGIVSDGTLDWYFVPSGERHGMAVVNASTNDMYLSLGYPAVMYRGILLKAYGGSFSLDSDIFQGAVYLINAGTNSLATGLEF